MVTITESPAERVKRYLVQELKDEYGAAVVYEDNAEHIGTFTDPQFTVHAEGEEYNAIGWATCKERVFSVLQTAKAEDAHEDTSDLISHVIDKVKEAVRLGRPVIATVGPPWYDVTVSSKKILNRPENWRVDLVFDFKTGLTPGGL